MYEAILFYGVETALEDNFPWDNVPEMGFREVVAARKGIFKPDEKYKGNEKKFKEYYKKVNKCIQEFGVSLQEFKYGTLTRKYLIITDSIIVATPEYPEPVFCSKEYNVWNNQLIQFFKLIQYKITLKPKWYLALKEKEVNSDAVNNIS